MRYDQVNAMLLNEFLKEHAIVQDLKKEIAALKVNLQQMSDQLKMNRSVQLAENRQRTPRIGPSIGAKCGLTKVSRSRDALANTRGRVCSSDAALIRYRGFDS